MFTCPAPPQEVLKVKEPPKPNLAEQEQEGAGDMFFQHPQQLLRIYSELEESNLFLIQNAQVLNCSLPPCPPAAPCEPVCFHLEQNVCMWHRGIGTQHSGRGL
jgi:hypothetical protein